MQSTFTVSRGINPLELLQDLFLMMAGVVLAGYALKGFMVPTIFLTGGQPVFRCWSMNFTISTLPW